MDSTLDARIESLEHHWRDDPTPHRSLELADLYRQADRLEEGIDRLESALEEHPRHLSLQVALGRYRMVAGEYRASVAILERVVDADPSHLVANKLLVRGYLELGDRKRARDRLDLYTLLNNSDPDIEALRESVETGEVLFDIPDLPVGTAPVLAPEPLGAGAATQEGQGETALSGVVLLSHNEPFQGLAEGLGSANDWDSILSEGIFAAPTAAEPAEEPADEEIAEGEIVVVEADYSATEPGAEEPQAQDLGVQLPAAATATLASLYQQQGHLEEAEETYRQVLEETPEHEEAQAGLDDVLAVEEPSEEATAEEAVAATEGVEELSLAQRKVARLSQYLNDFRAAVALRRGRE